MPQKYSRPEEISDEAIRQAFAGADTVEFSARRFNSVMYRSISFGDLGWWLPLKRVLPIIGITPQMLRTVFNLVDHGELPPVVESYEQLGCCMLVNEPFRELARILGKSVEVWREDGGTGDHRLLFTTRPTEEVSNVA